MNRNKLKTYAPAARRSFLQAVKDRATHYGLTAKKIEPVTERGDVVLIAGQPFPKAVAAKRKRLEEHINKVGYERAMEAVAYSWFNRFVAIRFMELHGYLDHGYRVLSHPAVDVQPEIIEHAQRVDFPGLDKNKVIELKLDGTKQEELYRLLLVAQCNALSRAMPFLFERIDDETELLLPSNLLATDSLIQTLVKEIDEEDWKEVEILGWLYQFYISERKDEVIGKVVASEDIPAATQLFTPNWIVKYLVQNTLGRIWLATYPQSGIRQQMEFYIEPAEQTPEVQEQLKAITPTSLNPEKLTLLDPACGSAHILVEAYDLFKAIYQERGYRAKDIPGLILQKNLYGLEIDDRAAQLAAFALLMKARADDRRILESGVQPAILSFVESKGMDAEAITHALNSPINGGAEGTVAKADIAALLELFEEAKTCGSLIQIPSALVEKLPTIEERLAVVLKDGDLTHAQSGVIAPLLRQAVSLARQYDAVVANPPYMGSKFYAPVLKAFVDKQYEDCKADLYACFIKRLTLAATPHGLHAMINIPNWMFLSSFSELRQFLFNTQTIDTFIHNGRGVFGSDFGSCAFVIRKLHLSQYRGSYRRLFEKQGSVASNEELASRFHRATTYTPCNADFSIIPGRPVAYWISNKERELYAEGSLLSRVAEPRKGLDTGDNDTFLRLWFEVSLSRCSFGGEPTAQAKWYPYNKGGEFRRWYGNREYVINWESNGAAIRERLSWTKKKPTLRNQESYLREGYTWTTISSTRFSARYAPAGCIFDNGGCTLFADKELHLWGSLLNSSVASRCLEYLAPTLNFQPGDIGRIPIAAVPQSTRIAANATDLVAAAKEAWDEQEVSWEYMRHPMIGKGRSIAESSRGWEEHNKLRSKRVATLEKENNKLFEAAYSFDDRPSADAAEIRQAEIVPEPAGLIKSLLSYAVGCMMGRYSLDKEGLIYAHSGNQGFDASQYTQFPADEDGIVPVTEAPWFEDDAANRFERSVKTVWPAETLEENIEFVAESLGAKKSETPRETIRRYFAGDFYKHHLQTYKNRPIYWLFSSGKQGAFEALVYLHRYNEGTLSRMRTEYVVPLLGKMNGQIGMLADTIATATSTKQRKDAEKEKGNLTKQLAELQAFDEQLNHFANQRITLDLDDGVKVNYGKFGNLLADVKKVCGKAEDD